MGLNNKPEFCFITPTDYLGFAGIGTTTHLTLAHLVDTNLKYANYYQRCRNDGHYVIMDNSAYELKEPYDTEKLIDLGHRCGANAIVLPDYPFQDSGVTIEAAKKYISDFKKDGFHTFFVPQSRFNDAGDWFYAYEWAAKHPDIDIIGMSILGIPNAIPNIDPSFSRVVMTQRLIDAGIFEDEKHHHYLGLNAGPGLEIPSLLRMGALNSIDSSGPVWAALLGHKYTTDADSLQSVSKLKMPVDFHHKMTKDSATLNRITHNIDLTNELFTTANEIAPWYAQE